VNGFAGNNWATDTNFKLNTGTIAQYVGVNDISTETVKGARP
jgi:hypothetical protein